MKDFDAGIGEVNVEQPNSVTEVKQHQLRIA